MCNGPLWVGGSPAFASRHDPLAWASASNQRAIRGRKPITAASAYSLQCQSKRRERAPCDTIQRGTNMERDTVLIDLALQGGGPHEASPAYIAMDLMSRVLSPYNLNTLGLNPLRSVDFDRLARSPIQLNPAVGACSTTPRRRRRSARFGLSPDDVPGNRNRRRPQTGWWVRRRSNHCASRP